MRGAEEIQAFDTLAASQVLCQAELQPQTGKSPGIYGFQVDYTDHRPLSKVTRAATNGTPLPDLAPRLPLDQTPFTASAAITVSERLFLRARG